MLATLLRVLRNSGETQEIKRIWALDSQDFVPAFEFKTRYESVHEVVFDSASKYLFALHSNEATDAWHIATSNWFKPEDVGWPFSL
jgi:hypothetical protein